MKEGHCFRDTVIFACKRARVGYNVVFESGQFATILAMVAAGVGISVVPGMAVQRAPGCRFVRIDDARAHRRFGIIHLKHHFLSKAQIALLKSFRETGKVALPSTLAPAGTISPGSSSEAPQSTTSTFT
jgi:LysR family hydrogen peroxide-inducible transcriptional activator